MRGSRVKALKSDTNPHPGRKFGGKFGGVRGGPVGGGMFWRFHKIGRMARRR